AVTFARHRAGGGGTSCCCRFEYWARRNSLLGWVVDHARRDLHPRPISTKCLLGYPRRRCDSASIRRGRAWVMVTLCGLNRKFEFLLSACSDRSCKELEPDLVRQIQLPDRDCYRPHGTNRHMQRLWLSFARMRYQSLRVT